MEPTESSSLLTSPPSHTRTESLRSKFLETKSASASLRAFTLPSSPAAKATGNEQARGDRKDAEEGHLGPLVRLGYAFGHAQNDLCAAMYFSYLLVYLAGAGMSPVDAGRVLIVGQVVDGCATPLVGLCSDRWDCFSNKCCFGLAGRRKSWYIGGLILVTATFWMLFSPVSTAWDGVLSPVVYYATANALFQVGWAAVQVSHMALVPEITPLLAERTFLNSARYAVTMATSITVYVLLLAFQRGAPATERTFQDICYLVLAAGAVMGIAFVALVHETKQNAVPETALEAKDLACGSVENAAAAPKTLVSWFSTPGFFGVMANYAFARLCGNTFQMYLPFYVMTNLPARPTALSTIPLVAYAGMILSSMVAPRVSARFPDALWLCAGATAVIMAGAAFLILVDPPAHAGTVFLAAGVLGAGAAQVMVASQTQVCELVGNNTCGGVVFGICSLCDKLSTAAVIAVLQQWAEAQTTALGAFYRGAAAGGPAACALLACAALMLVPTSIRDGERHGARG